MEKVERKDWSQNEKQEKILNGFIRFSSRLHDAKSTLNKSVKMRSTIKTEKNRFNTIEKDFKMTEILLFVFKFCLILSIQFKRKQ